MEQTTNGRCARPRLGVAGAFVGVALALSGCLETKLPSSSGELPTCCEGRGTCLPAAFVDPKELALLGGSDCSDANICVPNELIGVDPVACQVASSGAEGRCLPSCLAGVAARGDQLRQDDCEDSDRCVPCYDPLTGASTGACDRGAGPSEPPIVFAPCCEGPAGPSGACVPSDLLPPGSPDLPAQTCAEGTVCAPRAVVADPTAQFPACTSRRGSAGVCIEECYLPSLALSVSLGSDCEAGQRCVDCALLGAGVGGCAP